ncbi:MULTISPECIES: hypothetical protein [Niveibacterium]|uniref:Twin transmembrane helix small protein n=1 Tax=Niveibacterium microcysteis TaxID=2811415 RepID=A0ABX7M2W1_9RHOO|nr:MULTISPECIES: hypothetical protein [Niveibacterium]QSI76095.1 hypothetical protein JY500_16680 [Niveibacterium microcysteis]
MLILRLLVVLVAIGGVASYFAYLFTGRAGYLRLAKNLARFTLVAVLVFLGLLLLERVLMPVF